MAARNAAFLLKQVDNAVCRGRGNSDSSEACETRRGNPHDSAVRIHDCAANGRRCDANVEPNVGASAALAQLRRSATTRLTAPSAATGPLARVRPTTSARLPGLVVETSPPSAN